MIPLWVYAVAAGILFSAYMAIRSAKEEKRLEDEIIEREGEVYMKRLEQEKQEKREAQRGF